MLVARSGVVGRVTAPAGRCCAGDRKVPALGPEPDGKAQAGARPRTNCATLRLPETAVLVTLFGEHEEQPKGFGT